MSGQRYRRWALVQGAVCIGGGARGVNLLACRENVEMGCAARGADAQCSKVYARGERGVNPVLRLTADGRTWRYPENGWFSSGQAGGRNVGSWVGAGGGSLEPWAVSWNIRPGVGSSGHVLDDKAARWKIRPCVGTSGMSVCHSRDGRWLRFGRSPCGGRRRGWR